MSEAGGLLAVWTDIPGPLEADFNEWYDHEHLAERAGIAGFRTARRYIAESGSPKYFALYETDSLGVFASPEYQRYLGPLMTPWSRKIMGAFVNNHRRCCSFVARAGGGMGGAVASLRLGASQRCEDALRNGAMLSALACSGVVCAKAWRADLATTYPEAPPSGAFPELIVVVEGISPAAASAGADALLAAAFGADQTLHRGLYRLLHALPA